MTSAQPSLQYRRPSRFQLPQFVSTDVKRARQDTLRRARHLYEPKSDDLGGEEVAELHRLPVGCTRLPNEAAFNVRRGVEMLIRHKTILLDLNTSLMAMARFIWDRGTSERYQSIFEALSPSSLIMRRWHEDAEFGRQRLTGSNPMSLRRLDGAPENHERLREAAQYELHKRGHSFKEVQQRGRLFYVEYPHLAHRLVQKHLRPNAYLASPTCYFWVDDMGNLMPLAIQLKPASVKEKNPIFTPSGHYYDWMMARAHFQAADAHIHEGTYHLLETHMVSGAVAMALYRRLHPDHPLRQLMDPHFQFTLAINEIALGGLLAQEGTIDSTLAAGVQGTLNAARLFYGRWNFCERSLQCDLESRGVDKEDALPFYYYRDDATQVHSALSTYVKSILSLWYYDDQDVQGDCELQEWVKELSSSVCGLPGFPEIKTRSVLFWVVTELLFRAGPQHAAVNNGQFDSYGWIPNMPGRISSPLLDELPPGGFYTKKEYWDAMPSLYSTLSQLSMVSMLSAPTMRTLMHSGEAPAFDPLRCPEAETIVNSFQRQLASISSNIERRNQTLDIPYRYLNPRNISRSTDI